MEFNEILFFLKKSEKSKYYFLTETLFNNIFVSLVKYFLLLKIYK